MTQPADSDEIRALCAEAGLSITEVRDDGKVLVLVPEDLSALPDAAALQQLAERIRARDYRHVAFSVDADA